MTGLVKYRDKPLDDEGYAQLDRMASRAITFREREGYELRWEKDEYGDLVQTRIPTLAGPEMFTKGEVSPQLVASLQRPCKDTAVGHHLFRLSAHKPWCRGEQMWSVIIDDLTRDLKDTSEYAIMKACEFFRQQEELRYFPDTAVLLRRARDIDFALRALSKAAEPKPLALPAPKIVGQVNCKRNIKRVNRILSIGAKKPEHRTKREQQFMTAMKNKTEREKKIMEENKCDEDGVVK